MNLIHPYVTDIYSSFVLSIRSTFTVSFFYQAIFKKDMTIIVTKIMKYISDIIFLS